jgi:RNA 2',3'-cyclic 3'-phosphodiesterase
MPDTVRTFVAIPLVPAPSLRALIRRLDELNGPVKGVSPDQLHITLKFLGDTPWKQTAEIGQVVSQVAAIQPAFDAHVRGVGAFPGLDRPRVVWTGIEPAEPLTILAGLLNDLIGELGFPVEERAFQPHVTLARVKGRPPGELREELSACADQDFGGLHIDRLTYYQSELGPSGPKYTILSEHPLA